LRSRGPSLEFALDDRAQVDDLLVAVVERRPTDRTLQRPAPGGGPDLADGERLSDWVGTTPDRREDGDRRRRERDGQRSLTEFE